MSATPNLVKVFICGSDMRGQPDHKNLQGAKFIEETRTVSIYRLHAVADGWHPGIYEVDRGGISIPGEIYALTREQYHNLEISEPPNLYPQEVQLEDGSCAIAFLYPKALVDENDWEDVSHYGGWAVYKADSTRT